jgi:hypothetical protein
MIDGLLNSFLEGKTVEKAYKDGKHLIIHTTDGHEVYIGWADGEPVHIKTSVRIVIPPAFMSGIVGAM